MRFAQAARLGLRVPPELRIEETEENKYGIPVTMGQGSGLSVVISLMSENANLTVNSRVREEENSTVLEATKCNVEGSPYSTVS